MISDAIACIDPFRKIEVLSDGKVTMCCYSWLPRICGNLFTDSVHDVLSNADRLEVQSGMRSGNFISCTDHCPSLSMYKNRRDVNWPLVPLGSLDNTLSSIPYRVYMSYDVSCNLRCPSCRSGLVWHNPSDEQYGVISDLHNRVVSMINELLWRGERVNVIITGSGDPFASNLYRSYLLELASGSIDSRLTISIATNGISMTPEMMSDIKPIWPNIFEIEVSVDAATEGTYRMVRLGGDFDKLKHNLGMLDVLLQGNAMPNLSKWQTNFIVQRDNFRELREFVEWQLGYRALTRIWINRIAQWGHITDERYADMAVWAEGHPLRDELISIISNSVFDDPRIYMGNLRSLSDQQHQ